jgi:NADH:ubiquinone oxidoreductase subunit 5 (subunit L)/multisubunit Na+/H+ antiporter MnhA subunit
MSGVFVVALVLGALATALFVAGYVRGTIHAIRNHHLDSQPPASANESTNYAWLILLAVVCAAVAIGLIGVSPYLFYIGPFLAIGTAAVNGYAFFYDRVG